jgi:hypothetical protein
MDEILLTILRQYPAACSWSVFTVDVVVPFALREDYTAPPDTLRSDRV